MKIEIETKDLPLGGGTGLPKDLRGYAKYVEENGNGDAADVIRFLADKIEAASPKPIYSNRDDIFGPRKYDVVKVTVGSKHISQCYTYFSPKWRGSAGEMVTTEELKSFGPLRLVAEATGD